ncbi:MAG: phosphoribosyl-ATP diphosphatase, partial [Planctomycetota bacterium]
HRLGSAPAGSYSRKLFESPELLNAKLLEEADELTTAVARDEIIHEAADVVFFTLTRLVKENISWHEVARELDRRSLKVTRRSQQESQS